MKIAEISTKCDIVCEAGHPSGFLQVLYLDKYHQDPFFSSALFRVVIKRSRRYSIVLSTKSKHIKGLTFFKGRQK